MEQEDEGWLSKEIHALNVHTSTEKTTLASRRSAQQGWMDVLHFWTDFSVNLIYSRGG